MVTVYSKFFTLIMENTLPFKRLGSGYFIFKEMNTLRFLKKEKTLTL